MTDARQISGTVSTKSEDGLYTVAYSMALSLWAETHGHQKRPKMDDDAFFDLVQNCARSLSPNYYYKRVAKG
jgi:hypothetical protein